ncbi:RNA polymerase-binding protein DksA [Massilia cavernae]|uniref:RNA polymerase-binding protein DksA n=1 Tax=Massilia cavernae TaxID=2320864 RepID=UPI001E3DF2FB
MKGSETKTASKTAKSALLAAAAKPAADPKPAAAKPASRAAAKTPKAAAAAGSTKITATAKAVRTKAVKAAPMPHAAEAGSKAADGQPAAKAGKHDTSTAVVEAAVGLADKMKTSVVSKVSEVMTKITKSTPAVNTDGRLLSEEEIRAMNEKDYMNAAQLAFFKARLQQLEKDLLKNAGETTEHLRETVLVPDPADRATIEEEHALELRTRDRERKLLKKVQQSIASIDAGEYGWCEETGEPIGIPRLIARPTATLSLEAQQRRELKQKLYGD